MSFFSDIGGKIKDLFGGDKSDPRKGVLYTLEGCAKCKIARTFMTEQGISFVERNINGPGKEAFRAFMQVNGKRIVREANGGITFPVYVQGDQVLQGIGPMMGYLTSGEVLEGFFSVGDLQREWIDGIHVSEGDPGKNEMVLKTLRLLKKSAYHLQIDTDGRNSALLALILREGLGDKVIMNVPGPKTLYRQLLGKEVDLADVSQSMALTAQFPQHEFRTTMAPFLRQVGEQESAGYLTVEEVEEIALWIKEATGSMKETYVLRGLKPEALQAFGFKDLEMLTSDKLLPYRSAARNHQVFAELEKDEITN